MEWGIVIAILGAALLVIFVIQGLRKELASQLQANRAELNQGLSQTAQGLDSKIAHFDRRVEERFKNLTEGVQTRLEQNLKDGFQHFAKVQEYLKKTEQQFSNLSMVGQSISDLNNLLKLPHLRGNFGEAMLEKLLADILPAECFELQYHIVPNSPERVDAIIRYPQKILPIDSKFPREQVLPLFESSDPAVLEGARNRLHEVMKTLARGIKEKYIRPEHGTTELALLFVPSETLYFEVLRSPKLCEEIAKYRVFVVSPNTLAVTLNSISLAHSYYAMAKGVEKTILELKKAEQHFENFSKRFGEVGVAVDRALQAFGIATTHLARYQSAVDRLPNAVKIEPVPTPDSPSLQSGSA